MDIEKVCRTCLGLSGPLLSIYDGGGGGCIADMLRDFTKTNPRREDKLPEKVCLSCISEINRCYSFKLKCENSSGTLRQLVPDALPEEINELESKVKVTQAHKSVQTKPEVVKRFASLCTQTQENIGVTRTHQHVQTAPIATYEKSTSPIMMEQNAAIRYNNVKLEKDLAVKFDEEIEIVEGGRVHRGNNIRHALSLKRRRIEETDEDGNEIIIELDAEGAEISENAEGIALFSTIVEDPEGINENITTYYQLSNSPSGNESEKATPNNDNDLSETNRAKDGNDEYDEERVYTKFMYNDEAEVYNPADGDSESANYSFMVYKNDNSEAEIVTKRNATRKVRKVKKKPTVKEELKCAHCSMTFVSAKRLARHEFKRHGVEGAQKVSEVDKESEATQTATTNSTTKENNIGDNEDNPTIIITTEAAPTNATITPQPIVQKTYPADLAHFCDKCGAGFALQRSLVYHRKQDLCTKDTHNCDICDRVFISEETLKEHKATHLQEHECTDCGKFFETKDELSQHMVVEHKRSLRNQCPLCKKVFTILSALKDHLRVHSGEKPFVCEICDKGFNQKTNLKQHIMRHSKEKKFKCDECAMTFVTKGELCSHKRTHTGEHPFRCDECQATFTISSSLVKHKRIHTGERPYACDLCPQRFTSSFTLKNHRRMHTGEKPYKCRWCSKTFTQKQDCVIHHRTHTGERKHTCFCGEKFTHLGTLRTHMKTHEAYDTDGAPKTVLRSKRQSTQTTEGAIKHSRCSIDTRAFNITILDVDEEDEEPDVDDETVVTVLREDLRRLVAGEALRSNEEDTDTINEEKLMQIAIEKV